METLELNKLSDAQVEEKLNEMKSKKDVTPEEKEVLNTLKEERQTRFQKRIDKLSFEKRQAQEEKQRIQAELEAQKAEIEELKKDRQERSKPRIADETVEYGGKKYYTDDTLTAMVKSQELTPEQAYQHQRARDKAEIKFEIEQEQTAKSRQLEDKEIRKRDWEAMVAEYPEFDAASPDHNPEDPLYKTANELWREGLNANPRGLTLAIKRAKQILRMNDERPDTTNEHNVGRNRSAASNRTTIEKEVPLSPQEHEAAVRIYGGIINPATNRNYTEAEAIAKATKAKTARARG